VKAADLTISPVYQAAVGTVDSYKVFEFFLIEDKSVTTNLEFCLLTLCL